MPRQLHSGGGEATSIRSLHHRPVQCVALIVAAWVGTGALAGAAALLGVTSCRSAAAWVRATAI